MLIGNRGSHGAIFTIPYSRNYTQFNKAFLAELLITLIAAAIGVWVVMRHRRKG